MSQIVSVFFSCSFYTNFCGGLTLTIWAKPKKTMIDNIVYILDNFSMILSDWNPLKSNNEEN